MNARADAMRLWSYQDW